MVPKIAENPNVTAKPTTIKRRAEMGLGNDEYPSGTVWPQRFRCLASLSYAFSVEMPPNYHAKFDACG
jgi:hypothetical protein